MENERAKEKKQVWRNFMWAAMFLSILLFAVMGILLYMLIPDLKISPGTEKSLLLVASILSLAALFTWIFRYRPAFKIYRREYKVELEMVEKSRAFKVSLFLLIFLGFVIGWYLAHQAGFMPF
jgi:membrane protein YdbS with pleckstrin-like domain